MISIKILEVKKLIKKVILKFKKKKKKSKGIELSQLFGKIRTKLEDLVYLISDIQSSVQCHIIIKTDIKMK